MASSVADPMPLTLTRLCILKEQAFRSKEDTERLQWESQIESVRSAKEKEMPDAKSAWERNTADRLATLQETESAARKLLENELTTLKVRPCLLVSATALLSTI